ncbi:hypothetical protein M9H77_07254 [Catharanthus roseus]|uniref:Uncharacterized protein n=1 Tax=Catharanthus roseus TaxID=4058 RepID=A0ACC0BUM9_CATRO|nr:hypothetical protein M9H77_07254 [Catharanthus roseus]
MHPSPIIPDFYQDSTTGLGSYRVGTTRHVLLIFSVDVSDAIYSSVTVQLPKVKREPLGAWILRAFTGSETNDDLIMRTREFGSCALPQLLEDIDVIRTYSWALGGARQIGGALALFVWFPYLDRGMVPSDLWQTSMFQEVDDMASLKVQTIIQRCMISIGGTLGCTPSQHDIQQTFPVQPRIAVPRSTYRIGVLVKLRGRS